MHTTKLIVLLTSGALLLGAAACSDDETSSGACIDYSAVSGSPSFANDVMPIFQQSCNFSSCHSSAIPSPQEDLALGPENGIQVTQADLDAVHGAIVGAASVRSSMNLVTAGDPANSWLLAKVEYEPADLGTCAVCTPPCGDRMPVSSPALSDAALNTLRAWIKDGAQNN